MTARKRGFPARGGACIAALVLAAGFLAASPALAANSISLISSFGPDGTEATEFERAGQMAVDQQTHAVYVMDIRKGALYKFGPEGEPLDFGGSSPNISGNKISGFSFTIANTANEVAVNSQSHVVYVTNGASLKAFQANGEPAPFTAGPGVGTNEISEFTTRLFGVAVDANGDIYASETGPGLGANGAVKIYAPTGAPITQFEPPQPANLAVAPDGAVYVSRNDEGTVRKFTPSVFPVTAATTYTPAAAPINPNASPNFSSAAISINPASGDIYIVESGYVEFAERYWVAKYNSAGTFLTKFAGSGEEGEVAASSGVAIDETSNSIFVSTFGHSLPSLVEIFGTPPPPPGPPTIDSSSLTNVTADSAEVRASINPHTFETTYRIEYGPEDCAIVPDPCTAVPAAGASIGSGHEGVAVSQLLTGLQSGTTYHYRVVAENELGTPATLDRTFTTQLSGLGFGLADSRAWELVSPSTKFGGSISARALTEGITQAAADGNGLAYMTLGSIEAAPQGNRVIEPSSALARRGEGGWRSKDITPPHIHATPYVTGNGTEYKLFSPDLASALLEPRDDTPLSPQSSDRAPNLRHNTEPATYTPLVTAKEGFANVPPGTEFGGDEVKSSLSKVHVTGANAALNHVVLESAVPLVPGAAAGSLYQWAAGALQPVSALPAAQGGAVVKALLGSGGGTVRHAVSEGGSRVFWGRGEYSSSLFISLSALYLRDMAAEETTRLDVVQAGGSGADGASANGHGPAFQGASADGTVVFFTDSRQLTAGASPEGRDLYRCEIPPGEAESGCASLTDLSAPRVGSGESAEVQDLVSAISEDGSSLYFVAKGVLDTVPNQAGASATAGGFNLYAWQQGEGARFIATLSGEDSLDWGKGPTSTVGVASDLAAAASPSGRYLSFMSQRSLTGYDNRDAVNGEADQEAFRYDAASDRLVCVSCNPTGAAPQGLVHEDLVEGVAAVDPRANWNQRQLAAVLPEATDGGGDIPSLYRPRSVLDNGRVFFNAADSLVSADSNGTWDVYQYEPTGVGDCTAGSGGAAVSRTTEGCVSLLSSGTGEEESAFLDASENGNDVFFISPARLSVTDKDEVNDIYDARVNSVPAVLEPDEECLGEACQPPAQAPNDPTPASAAFHGAGNVPPAAKRCPKGKRKVQSKGKTRCVARRHKHKQHNKHKHKSRRPGR